MKFTLLALATAVAASPLAYLKPEVLNNLVTRDDDDDDDHQISNQGNSGGANNQNSNNDNDNDNDGDDNDNDGDDNDNDNDGDDNDDDNDGDDNDDDDDDDDDDDSDDDDDDVLKNLKSFRIIVDFNDDDDQLVSLKQGNGTGQLVAARYGKDVYFNLKNSSLAAINGTGVVFDDHTVELANSTQKAQQTNSTKNGWRIYENRLFWRGQHTWRACPLPRTNTTYTLSTKKCKDGEKVKLRVFV
ncbi:hypothetical protein DICA0_F00540 [Diutina catenulata]